MDDKQAAYFINGGKKLEGTIKLSGARNVAIKVIIAALLFENPVVINNIPHISDVLELITLINSMGADANFVEEDTVRVDGRNLQNNKPDIEHTAKIRTAFMLVAPLLYKFKEAYIPAPEHFGGRPIDRTIEGLKSLGIHLEFDEKTSYYHATMYEPPKGMYRYKKPSHTSTELLILMSVFSKDRVIIENAALEPEIDDLINFLNQAGAKIMRNGLNVMITGVTKLEQKQPYTISPDRNEAVMYATLGVITKGKVTISSIPESFIRAFHDALLKTGTKIEKAENNSWSYSYAGTLKSASVTTEPHPGFMANWQPLWTVLMTQASGQAIIQERIYESKFSYIEELRKLGAEIDFVKMPVHNPIEYFFFNVSPNKIYNQAIRVIGPQQLKEGVVMISDLRYGPALAIAALTAVGESIVKNVYMLEKGYEDFVEKVQSLGGDIEKD